MLFRPVFIHKRINLQVNNNLFFVPDPEDAIWDSGEVEWDFISNSTLDGTFNVSCNLTLGSISTVKPYIKYEM